MLPILLVIFNTVVLLIVIILSILMARWGYIFTQNIGDSPVIQKQMWRILKSLLFLMVITVIAAAVNALYATS